MGTSRKAGTPVGLLIVTGAFAAMLLSANLATSLYAGYSERFGFSPAVLASSSPSTPWC